MQASHDFSTQEHHEPRWEPTLKLAWAHVAIALVFGALAITGTMPPVLAIFTMAFFGAVAILCALATLFIA